MILKVPKYDSSIQEKKMSNIELLIDDQSSKSTKASGIVNLILEDYSKQIVADRLSKMNVDASIITHLI